MTETEAVEIRRKAFKQNSLFESLSEDDVEKYQDAFNVRSKSIVHYQFDCVGR